MENYVKVFLAILVIDLILLARHYRNFSHLYKIAKEQKKEDVGNIFRFVSSLVVSLMIPSAFWVLLIIVPLFSGGFSRTDLYRWLLVAVYALGRFIPHWIIEKLWGRVENADQPQGFSANDPEDL